MNHILADTKHTSRNKNNNTNIGNGHRIKCCRHPSPSINNWRRQVHYKDPSTCTRSRKDVSGLGRLSFSPSFGCWFILFLLITRIVVLFDLYRNRPAVIQFSQALFPPITSFSGRPNKPFFCNVSLPSATLTTNDNDFFSDYVGFYADGADARDGVRGDLCVIPESSHINIRPNWIIRKEMENRAATNGSSFPSMDWAEVPQSTNLSFIDYHFNNLVLKRVEIRISMTYHGPGENSPPWPSNDLAIDLRITNSFCTCSVGNVPANGLVSFISPLPPFSIVILTNNTFRCTDENSGATTPRGFIFFPSTIELVGIIVAASNNTITFANSIHSVVCSNGQSVKFLSYTALVFHNNSVAFTVSDKAGDYIGGVWSLTSFSDWVFRNHSFLNVSYNQIEVLVTATAGVRRFSVFAAVREDKGSPYEISIGSGIVWSHNRVRVNAGVLDQSYLMDSVVYILGVRLSEMILSGGSFVAIEHNDEEYRTRFYPSNQFPRSLSYVHFNMDKGTLQTVQLVGGGGVVDDNGCDPTQIKRPSHMRVRGNRVRISHYGGRSTIRFVNLANTRLELNPKVGELVATGVSGEGGESWARIHRVHKRFYSFVDNAKEISCVSTGATDGSTSGQIPTTTSPRHFPIQAQLIIADNTFLADFSTNEAGTLEWGLDSYGILWSSSVPQSPALDLTDGGTIIFRRNDVTLYFVRSSMLAVAHTIDLHSVRFDSTAPSSSTNLGSIRFEQNILRGFLWSNTSGLKTSLIVNGDLSFSPAESSRNWGTSGASSDSGFMEPRAPFTFCNNTFTNHTPFPNSGGWSADDDPDAEPSTENVIFRQVEDYFPHVSSSLASPKILAHQCESYTYEALEERTTTTTMSTTATATTTATSVTTTTVSSTTATSTATAPNSTVSSATPTSETTTTISTPTPTTASTTTTSTANASTPIPTSTTITTATPKHHTSTTPTTTSTSTTTEATTTTPTTTPSPTPQEPSKAPTAPVVVYLPACRLFTYYGEAATIEVEMKTTPNSSGGTTSSVGGGGGQTILYQRYPLLLAAGGSWWPPQEGNYEELLLKHLSSTDGGNSAACNGAPYSIPFHVWNDYVRLNSVPTTRTRYSSSSSAAATTETTAVSADKIVVGTSFDRFPAPPSIKDLSSMLSTALAADGEGSFTIRIGIDPSTARVFELLSGGRFGLSFKQYNFTNRSTDMSFSSPKNDNNDEKDAVEWANKKYNVSFEGTSSSSSFFSAGPSLTGRPVVVSGAVRSPVWRFVTYRTATGQRAKAGEMSSESTVETAADANSNTVGQYTISEETNSDKGEVDVVLRSFIEIRSLIDASSTPQNVDGATSNSAPAAFNGLYTTRHVKVQLNLSVFLNTDTLPPPAKAAFSSHYSFLPQEAFTSSANIVYTYPDWPPSSTGLSTLDFRLEPPPITPAPSPVVPPPKEATVVAGVVGGIGLPTTASQQSVMQAVVRIIRCENDPCEMGFLAHPLRFRIGVWGGATNWMRIPERGGSSGNDTTSPPKEEDSSNKNATASSFSRVGAQQYSVEGDCLAAYRGAIIANTFVIVPLSAVLWIVVAFFVYLFKTVIVGLLLTDVHKESHESYHGQGDNNNNNTTGMMMSFGIGPHLRPTYLGVVEVLYGYLSWPGILMILPMIVAEGQGAASMVLLRSFFAEGGVVFAGDEDGDGMTGGRSASAQSYYTASDGRTEAQQIADLCLGLIGVLSLVLVMVGWAVALLPLMRALRSNRECKKGEWRRGKENASSVVLMLEERSSVPVEASAPPLASLLSETEDAENDEPDNIGLRHELPLLPSTSENQQKGVVSTSNSSSPNFPSALSQTITSLDVSTTTSSLSSSSSFGSTALRFLAYMCRKLAEPSHEWVVTINQQVGQGLCDYEEMALRQIQLDNLIGNNNERGSGNEQESKQQSSQKSRQKNKLARRKVELIDDDDLLGLDDYDDDMKPPQIEKPLLVVNENVKPLSSNASDEAALHQKTKKVGAKGATATTSKATGTPLPDTEADIRDLDLLDAMNSDLAIGNDSGKAATYQHHSNVSRINNEPPTCSSSSDARTNTAQTTVDVDDARAAASTTEFLANRLSRMNHMIGEVRWLPFELCSFAIAAGVGLVEGSDASTTAACRARSVVMLCLIAAQTGLALILRVALVPVEMGFLAIISVLSLILSVVGVAAVFYYADDDPSRAMDLVSFVQAATDTAGWATIVGMLLSIFLVVASTIAERLERSFS